MDSTSTEPDSGVAVHFGDGHWKARWVVVGLIVLVSWRAIWLLDREWVQIFPWWLALVLFGTMHEVFFLLFPVVTRTPRYRFSIPPFKKCATEFGIAVAVLIGLLASMFLIEFVVNRLWPGTTLVPDTLQRMAETPRQWTLFVMITISFTLVPFAEEMFFRGFLQNAFSERMPVVVATLLQASIFGAGHTFGLKHNVEAGLMGVILTLLYRWRRTLITPIVVHAGSNFISSLFVLAMALAYAKSPMLGVVFDPGSNASDVQQVVPNSAAEKAGICAGDVIVTFNGEAIKDAPQLVAIVRRYKVGDTVPVVVDRDGEKVEVTVVLQRRDL